MLRRNKPLEYQHILASDSETESDDQSKSLSLQAQGRDKGKRVEKEFYRESMKWKDDPDAMMRHAQMYQDYMKEIKIPTMGGSVIPFNTWQGLAKSMKKLYGQPLHYLTNLQLKQWDQSRIGTEDEYKPMDNIIHPCKAETTIWFIEEIHRTSTSAHHLSRLWLADPMYNAFIDPFVPQS